MAESMIFVLSFHRSGTQSTHHFLENAGYSAIHNPSGRSKLDFQHEWVGHETNLDFIFSSLMMRVAPTFNAVSDNPMAALHEHAFSAYPDAKFILVTRDPKKWAKSVREHIGNRDLVPAEKVQYWRYLDCKPNKLAGINDEDLFELYLKHQKETIDFFENNGAPQQLCVVDLDNPEIGTALSDFLSIPLHPMPQIDTKKQSPFMPSHD